MKRIIYALIAILLIPSLCLAGSMGNPLDTTTLTTGDLITSAINNILYIDGVTYAQTSAGIQAAVDALPLTGGTIVLPAAEYEMSESGATGYCVNINKAVYFKGAGAGFSSGDNKTKITRLKLKAGEDCGMFKFQDSTNHIYFSGIEQIEFEGNKDSVSTFAGDFIYFDDVSDAIIRDNMFRNIDIAGNEGIIYFDEESWGNWVLYNDFEDSGSATGVLSKRKRTWVIGNHFRAVDLGIRFTGVGSSTQAGGWIMHNDFEEVNTKAIHLSGTTAYVKIDSNYAMDCGGSGTYSMIYLTATVNHIDITNNTIVSGASQDYGVELASADNNYINMINNDFSVASTPYQINASANANGVIVDIPADGKIAFRENTALQINSAGDDKNISIEHNDTDGVITTSSGDIVLTPETGSNVTVSGSTSAITSSNAALTITAATSITLETTDIITDSVSTRPVSIVLADDATTTLPTSTTGILNIFAEGDNDAGIFFIQDDGTSTLSLTLAGSVASTDSDGDLCVITGADPVVIKNRLGSEKTIVYIYAPYK